MPKLVNKKTGKEYLVTAKDLEAMRKKPGILKAFKVLEAEVPAEVQVLAKTKKAVTKSA